MKGTLTLEFRENKEKPHETEVDAAFDVEDFDPVVFANALARVEESTSDDPEAIESLLFWAMMISRKRHKKDADENDAEKEEEATDE